jgi:hypothetical protein
MEYFTHLPEFQVIICKECQHAVLPSYIDVHFAAKPQHGLENKERRRVAEVGAEIDGLIVNDETLSQCKFPFHQQHLSQLQDWPSQRRIKSRRPGDQL